MFYPTIVRRADYPLRSDGQYYQYSHYREVISEDCQHRCVYCDVTLQEHASEGMQLDHFKPQELFPALKNDPGNLVLSCPKCNRLKSSHWPVNAIVGIDGFLDPFTANRTRWYNILPCGEIKETNPATGIKIKLLQLNRPARKQLRRMRLIEQRIEAMDNTVSERLQALREVIESDEVSGEDKGRWLEQILRLREQIQSLRAL